MATWFVWLISVASVIVCCRAIAADGDRFDDRITGDWGRARLSLSERGVDVSVGYVGEWVRNVTGGSRTTSAYADQIALHADADLARLFNWSGGSIHLLITNRNGPQLDARASLDTLLETHEIFGRGHYTRLTRFYLQQDLWGERVSLKAGRSDVDFFPFSCDFINISFCGALPGYHSNGWYTWPIGQYFANVTFRSDGRSYLKLGVSDVNSRNLDGDQGLHLRTADAPGRGTLANAEAAWLPRFAGTSSGVFRIGYWRDSTNYPDLLLNRDGAKLPLAGGSPRIHDSSHGYYVLAQQQLTGDGIRSGLTVFANFSHAESSLNKVDQLVSLGAWYSGPFPSRPDDRLGIAFGYNRVSSHFRELERLANASAGDRGRGSEKPLELNYSIVFPRGLTLMPSVQYVHDAGGRELSDDVWIVGAKLSADF